MDCGAHAGLAKVLNGQNSSSSKSSDSSSALAFTNGTAIPMPFVVLKAAAANGMREKKADP